MVLRYEFDPNPNLNPSKEARLIEQVKQEITDYYFKDAGRGPTRVDALRDYTSELTAEVLDDNYHKGRDEYGIRDFIRQRKESDKVYKTEFQQVANFAVELKNALSAIGVSKFAEFNMVFEFLSRDILRECSKRRFV